VVRNGHDAGGIAVVIRLEATKIRLREKAWRENKAV
jgi:hypothetical protein